MKRYGSIEEIFDERAAAFQRQADDPTEPAAVRASAQRQADYFRGEADQARAYRRRERAEEPR